MIEYKEALAKTEQQLNQLFQQQQQLIGAIHALSEAKALAEGVADEAED